MKRVRNIFQGWGIASMTLALHLRPDQVEFYAFALGLVVVVMTLEEW